MLLLKLKHFLEAGKVKIKVPASYQMKQSKSKLKTQRACNKGTN